MYKMYLIRKLYSPFDGVLAALALVDISAKQAIFKKLYTDWFSSAIAVF